MEEKAFISRVPASLRKSGAGIIGAVLLGVMCGTQPLQAALRTPASTAPDIQQDTGKSTAADREGNKAIVLDFLDQVMNRHQVSEAANRYLSEAYIQHNPNVADGRQAFIDAFTQFLKKNPERSWTPKQVFLDGQYVIVHGLYRNKAGDRGIAAVDIFRIKGGRIDEHWDVLQPIPEAAANPHPMF